MSASSAKIATNQEPKATLEEEDTVPEEQTEHDVEAQVDQGLKSDLLPGPDHTRVYEHLSTYPIANSWMRIHSRVPIPHVLRPRLFGLAYTAPVKQYTELIDYTLDSYLNRLDERVPIVKTLRMRDIRDSMTNPIVHGYQDINKLVNERITGPVRTTVYELRKSYSPRGTALVRSQFDPLVKPINDRLAAIIVRIDDLTEEPVQTDHPDEFSNELSHTVCLLSDGYHKGTPILVDRFRAMQTYPRRATDQIRSIYQENKHKRGDGSLVIFIASVDTARQLVSNGYSLATSGVTRVANGVTTRIVSGNGLVVDSDHKAGPAAAATPIEMDVSEAV